MYDKMDVELIGLFGRVFLLLFFVEKLLNETSKSSIIFFGTTKVNILNFLTVAFSFSNFS